MRLLPTIIALLAWLSVQSQIRPERDQHDFGTLSGDDKRYTDFTLVNTTAEDLFILRVQPDSRNVQFAIENTYVPPGDSSRIRLLYNPRSEGRFAHRIEVYHSAGDRPVTLKIRGQVKDLFELERQNCPDFNASPEEKRRALLVPVIITVVDAQTQQPIPKAAVQLARSVEEILQETTNRNGQVKREMPLGLYGIQVDVADYHPYGNQVYVKRGQHHIRVELDPVMPDVQPRNEPVASRDPSAEEGPEAVEKEVFLYTEEVQPETRKQNAEVEKTKPVEAIEKTVFEQHEKPEATADAVPGSEPKQAEEIEEELVSQPEWEENPDFHSNEYKPSNIVFLIDHSVSMKHEEKLEVLKEAMYVLVDLLRPIDRVAVVMYATDAEVLIPSQPVAGKEALKARIAEVNAGGQTYGARGLREAYDAAEKGYLPDGVNQVFLATDGAFEEGTPQLKRIAKRYARQGISLHMIGVKNGSWTEDDLQSIATEGGGSYIRIDSKQEARKVLVEHVKELAKR